MGALDGRRAIVTGASRGIGAAIAERFAAEGAGLVITARTVDEHDHLAGSLRETLERCRRHHPDVHVVAADLSSPDDRARIVPEAVEALGGPIDVLVSNAAAGIHKHLSEFPYRHRRVMFEVNFEAPLDLAQAVLPGMVEAGEGWIVNVSSGSARLQDGPPFDTGGVRLLNSIYGATKAALNRMTNALAVELYGQGVRVNTIQPGAVVWTEGTEAIAGELLDRGSAESLETMAEATLALCTCPPDHTGRIEVSQDLLARLGRAVRGLDGTEAPGGN